MCCFADWVCQPVCRACEVGCRRVCWGLTDERLEAVGHGVAQVRLATQVRAVSVEHEAIQL